MFTMKSKSSDHDRTYFMKLFSAVFYGVVSSAVIFINKIVLSTYGFHHFHFLAAAQFGWTALVLLILHSMRKIDIPPLSMAIVKEIAPVSVLFFGNIICGLSSTRSLNLPMFTVLRRFSILMTMIGEYFVLSYTPSCSVAVSVSLMICGAIVAALHDFSFDLYGYTMVLLNDLFTALNGVYLKKASMSTKCSSMGVLFYNSMFSFWVLVAYFVSIELQTMLLQLSISPTGTFAKFKSHEHTLSGVVSFEGWQDVNFCLLFVLATVLGSVLNYAIFLCTSTNTALTTAVVGCLKNVLVTYCSMLVLSDYYFNWMNFLGVNISIVGSLVYTYATVKKSSS